MTAVFSVYNAKRHQDMKAISLKVTGQTVNVRSLCSDTWSFLTRHSVSLAVLGTAAVYAGVILGSDPLTYAAAFAALGFVRLADTKGGDA